MNREKGIVIREAEILVSGFFRKGSEPKLDLPCDTCRFFYMKNGKGRCKLEKSVTNANKEDDCVGYQPGRVTGY